MKWFIVKYLYQILVGEREQRAQFDEQTRLILAFDKAEALLKAGHLAETFHKAFDNSAGERVQWKFICIKGLNEIETPHDGQELFSLVHEPENAVEYLAHAMKQKHFLEAQLMDCSVFL